MWPNGVYTSHHTPNSRILTTSSSGKVKKMRWELDRTGLLKICRIKSFENCTVYNVSETIRKMSKKKTNCVEPLVKYWFKKKLGVIKILTFGRQSRGTEESKLTTIETSWLAITSGRSGKVSNSTQVENKDKLIEFENSMNRQSSPNGSKSGGLPTLSILSTRRARRLM